MSCTFDFRHFSGFHCIFDITAYYSWNSFLFKSWRYEGLYVLRRDQNLIYLTYHDNKIVNAFKFKRKLLFSKAWKVIFDSSNRVKLLLVLFLFSLLTSVEFSYSIRRHTLSTNSVLKCIITHKRFWINAHGYLSQHWNVFFSERAQLLLWKDFYQMQDYLTVSLFPNFWRFFMIHTNNASLQNILE